jgi:hypothetical protein
VAQFQAFSTITHLIWLTVGRGQAARRECVVGVAVDCFNETHCFDKFIAEKLVDII